LSITIAVVIRDGGDVVLVDAGFSRQTCADPRRSIGWFYSTVLGIRTGEGCAIVDQLTALGIDPARVRTVVATHLHLDHIGGVVDFPEAELICSEAELAAFRKTGRGYRKDDLASCERIRPVAMSGPPRLGFPASHDLFGDGQVVLLQAIGHTPGHVAVALRAGETQYVHSGDAADQLWEMGLEPPGPSLQGRLIAWRTDELVRTYELLRTCVADPCRPILVPAHDLSVFARLPQAPQGLSS